MYKFFAPVLSAQFITDATGKEFEILSLIPLRPPLPIQQLNKARLDLCVKLAEETMQANEGLTNQSILLLTALLFSIATYLFYSLIDSIY